MWTRPAALAALRAAVERALARGLKVGVLVFTADEAAVAGLPVVVMAFGPEAEPETAGRRLFAALRELDARGVDVILARLPARAGLGLAIWDRLYRAAEGRVTAV